MNNKILYKSYFFERYLMIYIIGTPIFIFSILYFIQIRKSVAEFQFSINNLKEFMYKLDLLILLLVIINFILMFFIYSYSVTNNYIEKKYIISVWKNKKINIYDISFIEFEIVNGYGGSLSHFFIHYEKEIIELECVFFYKKLYNAFKKTGFEINIRQENINRYPNDVKRVIAEGMEIKVNPLLEEKYLRINK